MQIFDALDISGSGLSVQRRKLTAIASNLANVDTTRTDQGGPYKRRRVVMLEAPWINREPAAESKMTRPFPDVEAGYALPLAGPGLGIELDESAAAAEPFRARRQPKLRALDGSVRDW